VALAKVNDENGENLYVFCFDVGSGRMTAAYDRTLLGTDIRTQISTVDFNWPRPGSSDPVPKEVTRVPTAERRCHRDITRGACIMDEFVSAEEKRSPVRFRRAPTRREC
jgi:hypothetical protein